MIAHKLSMGFRSGESGELPGQSSKVIFDFLKSVSIFFKCDMVHCPAEKCHCSLGKFFGLLEPIFFLKFSGI